MESLAAYSMESGGIWSASLISLSEFSARLGYQFQDEQRLNRALTHCSAGQTHNELLEFLGDALLNCIIAIWLYNRFSDASEGQLSRLRATLVDKSSLITLAKCLGLNQFIRLGPGELRDGGRQRGSIQADALEAIVAAIYQDSDFETCQGVVLGWYQSRLTRLTLEDDVKDPKTQLQEWLQAIGRPLPHYEVINETMNAGRQHFSVRCSLEDGEQFAEAEGNSRRKSEQLAAGILLEQLQRQDYE